VIHSASLAEGGTRAKRAARAQLNARSAIPGTGSHAPVTNMRRDYSARLFTVSCGYSCGIPV
jgi:hypothetical protein